MDPMSMIGLASMGIGAFQSLFGGGNPNEWAMDAAKQYDREAQQWLNPNNRFYTAANQNYYKNLKMSLGGAVPQAGSLLAMTGRMQGGAYGGSVMQANLLREKGMTEAFDVANRSTQQFAGSLYQQGLGQYSNLKQLGASMRNVYAGGQTGAQQYQGSFGNAMMGSGASLLSYANWGGNNNTGMGNRSWNLGNQNFDPTLMSVGYGMR